VARGKLRADSYRLLAACYYRPQKAFEDEKVFENLIAAFQSICQEAAAYARALKLSFSQENEQDLLVDYAKLFVGPYELLAPPYGSVYLEKKRQVMGNSTATVQDIYKDMGLSMDADFHELPDHIAVELEFMSFLVQEEIKAHGRGDAEVVLNLLQKQKKFLSDHLGAWVYDFSEKIQQGCGTSFYKNLALCTSQFVKGDMQYLASQAGKALALSLPCLGSVKHRGPDEFLQEGGEKAGRKILS